jgi:hypothetical protein
MRESRALFAKREAERTNVIFMREYVIKRVSAEPDWSAIPYLEIDNARSEKPDGITARAQICYGDDALLVHLETKERNFIANENGPLASPCRDSCLEFFFCPCEGDGRYFNIEFNSNGCFFLGIGSGIEDLVRLILEGKKANTFDQKIKSDDEGWEILYRVPYEFIRRFFPQFEACSEKKIIANCYKCSGAPKHYLTWSWLEGEPLSFHNTKCFGTMIFE